MDPHLPPRGAGDLDPSHPLAEYCLGPVRELRQKHTVEAGGNLLTVREPCSRAGPKYPWDERPKIGKKQPIIGFSKKARYNLAKELSVVTWPIPPAHITLTYHLDWPKNPKADLDKLQHWAKYRGFSGVWRLEFQDRQKPERHFVPHYHILLHGFTESDEEALRKWWAKVSGNDSTYAVKVTYREAGKAAWYLALHTAKGSQAPNLKVGRWWGWIDRDKVQSFVRRLDVGTLNDKQNAVLRRIARKLTRGRLRPRRGQSFSLFLSEFWQARVLSYLHSHYGDHLPF